ncbi:MAG: hypothetical protein H6624_17670 [Bdellovibrionaceae bacterium]|nr:hypothetical protein [Bdellovibrionales bacterium]MCB9086174.1 hypothetical protein [Pseudobdellovibrionaceae bacterium]
MKQRIIVAGNPEYGIGQGIYQKWPEAEFASRRNGFDLTEDEGRTAFARRSMDFDVVIFCSALWRFNQTILVEQVWRTWSEQKKAGHLICLGSTADVGARASNWLYPIEKKSLQSLCQNLSWCIHKGSPIKVTYLSLGYVLTPKTEEKHPQKKKLSVSYVVDLVDWVLHQPEGVNVNSMSLDPCQPHSEMPHQ